MQLMWHWPITKTQLCRVHRIQCVGSQLTRDAGPMLAQRRRRLANVYITLGQLPSFPWSSVSLPASQAIAQR